MFKNFHNVPLMKIFFQAYLSVVRLFRSVFFDELNLIKRPELHVLDLHNCVRYSISYNIAEDHDHIAHSSRCVCSSHLIGNAA